MRFLLGVLLTAVIMFGWGFLFWALGPLFLPPEYQLDELGVFRPLPETKAEAIVTVLKDANLPSGTYLYPYPYPPEFMKLPEEERKTLEKQMEEKHKEGPLLEITYRYPGVDAMDPKVMFIPGALHFFVSAFLMGLLVKGAALDHFLSRYIFILLAGIMAAVWIDLSRPIWFHLPWETYLYHLTYHISIWIPAGVTLAWGTRPTLPVPH